MSVIRVGSNGTYAEGWDQIFGGRTGKSKTGGKAAKKGPKQAGKKKAKVASKPKAKKPAARKKAAKRR